MKLIFNKQLRCDATYVYWQINFGIALLIQTWRPPSANTPQHFFPDFETISRRFYFFAIISHKIYFVNITWVAASVRNCNIFQYCVSEYFVSQRQPKQTQVSLVYLQELVAHNSKLFGTSIGQSAEGKLQTFPIIPLKYLKKIRGHQRILIISKLDGIFVSDLGFADSLSKSIYGPG